MKFSIRKAANVASCLVLFVALCGADSCGGGSKTVEITILHTNDIHSHLKAEPSHSERNPYGLGGLARVKTLVDRIRAEKSNVLLLDGGDWGEGTMYFAADAGTNMLKLFDAIGYDAVVVGNHDFLIGPSQLASAVERAGAKFPVLGANKHLGQVPDGDRVGRAIKDYTIVEVGGVKVGIIGLLTDDFFYFEYFKPGIITNPVEKASALAKKLHDEKLADVIILLSHNSFEKEVTWAKTIPWVNVIVSGHSHKKLNRAVETTNAGRPAYVVEAKEWAQFLGELTLTVEKESGKVTMKKWTPIPVSADIPEDPTIKGMIEDQDRALAAKYGKDVANDHVGDCADEMVHDDLKEVPIANMAADAYRAAAKTQIAMESVQLIGVGISPGPLSTMDVSNIQPHIYGPLADPSKPFPEFGSTWTVKRLRLKGGDIRMLLNVTLLANNLGIPLGWISLSGAQVQYTVDGGAGATRTIKIYNEATGGYELIDHDALYTVGIHDGLLLALRVLISKLHLPIQLGNLEDTGIEAWQAILQLLAAKGGTIRAADFEAGTRYNSLQPDLGFYEHHVQVKPRAGRAGYVVSVAVQNEGLSPSAAGVKLRVLRSAPNDALNDSTPGNEATPIAADASVPVLNPGDRTIVEVPWDNLPGPGVYALKVSLVGANDAHDRNNSLVMHTRVPAAR